MRQIVGIRAMNRTLLSLFQEAYGEEFKWNNRLLLEVNNEKALKIPQDTLQWDLWFENNLYCYELILPANKQKKLFNNMQQDLNRYFSYEAKIERRKVQCLILKRITGGDKICSTGGNPSKQRLDGKIIIKNLPLHTSLFGMIANANSNLSTPLVDKTDYKSNIDIEITDQLQNIELLRKDLNKYGLDLVLTETEIDMLVIRDKKENGKYGIATSK
jgi:hypothetical protein